jgi:hypothetical protein
MSFFDQKLGGHFSKAVGGAGDEDARHSEIPLRYAIVRKLQFKKGLFGTVMAVVVAIGAGRRFRQQPPNGAIR